ncbi:hypothetical protein [Mucilaginibacter defluvii]|uniref:Uncharacterized protein n=1 Tax=Mucilaginibacter defluvii TaxID=1196019 RepID=A0ABP9FLW6_9SPHI
MKMKQSAINVIAAIAVSIIVYFTVPALLYNSFFVSLAPGWHTTIYPFGSNLNLTVLILIVAVIVNLLFKGIAMLLKRIIAQF